MKDKNYTCFAVFKNEPDIKEEAYNVYFPDFKDCFTCGFGIENSFKMAKEALELTLFGMINDNKKIPEPSKPENIKVPKNGFLVPVTVNIEKAINRINNKSVNKMVTLPQWLKIEAEERGINFSKVLREALIKIIESEK